MNHTFDVDEAKAYGVDAAIVMQNLRFWLTKNKANDKNVIDGYVWTYNSAKAFSVLFPYWSPNKIQKLLKKMEADGLIVVSCHNKVLYDRKKWFSMPEYAIQPNGSMESADPLNGISQKAQPIADGKPDNKPDSNFDLEKIKQNAFDHWYQSFPKKTAKQSAIKAWFKLTKGKSPEYIEDLTNHIANDIAKKMASLKSGDKTYFGFDSMHPTTYLNQERFNDE